MLAGLFLAGPLGPVTAAPNDEVFTVGNYPVDADAANAVAAKQKAMADGQQAAFRSLLKRLVPVTSFDRLKRLSQLKASGFLEGVSVRSERNSPTRYIASLDFSFRADSVRTVLQQEGIPFVEDQARDSIIVPVVRNADGSIDAGAAARAWTESWKSLDLEHSLTPFSLQAAKTQIHADTLKMAVEGRGGAKRIVAGEYGSPYVILAIADADAATKRLNVTLSGIDAVGSFTLPRSYRVYDGDTAYAMELAAVVGLGGAEGRWKAHKLPAAGGSSMRLPIPPPPRRAVVSRSPCGLSSRASPSGARCAASCSACRASRTSASRGSGPRCRSHLAFPRRRDESASALYARGLALENGADRLILRSAY